jgi:integrase
MKKPYRLWKRTDRRGVYYFCQGDGPWRSTGTPRRAEAEAYALAAIEKAREAARQAAEAAKLQRETVPLREYLKPFYGPACVHVARLRAEKKSIGAEHVKHCRAILDKHIVTDPIAERNVRELRRGDIEDFRGRLLARGLGDGQVNRILRVLKTCLREGVHREDLERDPAAGVGLIHHRYPERGVFSRDELKALFPASGLGPWGSLQTYCLFMFAATMGARRSEILALRWRDIDLDKKEANIRQAWKSETELGPPKWGRAREGLPLPATTAARLRELRKASLHVLPDALVFHEADGGRLSSRWYQEAFHAGMKAAKIDAKARRLTGHSFRHSLATALRDAGVSAEKVQAALGWRDTKTMDGYTHFSAEHLRGQAELIDKLFS